jgi:hypothetical protein
MKITNVVQMYSWLAIFSLLTLSMAPTPRVSSGLHTQEAATMRTQTDWGKMPLYFIANQGQVDSRVVYYVQGGDKTLYFTPQGVTFALNGLTSRKNNLHPRFGKGVGKKYSPLRIDERSTRWIIKLDFVGANSVQPIGQEQTQAVVSYFKGLPDEWHAGLPTYSKIVYADLWEGIDLTYSGTVDRLKYEFVVKPGVNPQRIRLAYRGATVSTDESGRLEVSTPAAGFQDDSPVAYQEVDGQRVPVEVEYAPEDETTYGFHLGAYNHAVPLVIDPAVLVYCGYIGGSAQDWGYGIDVDDVGNAYVTGFTLSSETSFPDTVGPDLTYNVGDKDAFVAKIIADGTVLVYAGYIGGSGEDYGKGIAVDTGGNAYVVGYTLSSEATFPVAIGPDLTFNGNYDTFVAKVKSDGTGLAYAGYIGGGDKGQGLGIAVDSLNNAYVTGLTLSSETTFPVSIGPDLTFNGNYDAFVAKVKMDGTGLTYAGYIGGSDSDEGLAIAVDSVGNAYITGDTSSSETTFPVSVGPDLSHNLLSDVFVAKLLDSGAGFAYVGYIGGSGYENGNGIAVDTAGNAYITGMTASYSEFPVTVGPDLSHNGALDAFVAKVKADGTGLDYCGFIGGAEREDGFGIAVDSAGNAYVVGDTSSSEVSFLVTVGPDLTFNKSSDAFIAKVKPAGDGLEYAGFIGGNSSEYAYGIAVDSEGNAYVVGGTASTEATFPETVGPDLTHNSGDDAFVAKVSESTFSSFLYLPVIVH